ncbi:MAG: radical SAM protein [Methanomassiliicoccales archaeon]
MALFTLGQMAYYAGWFMKSKLGMKRPLVLTMVITYGCNLDCEHCQIRENLEGVPPPHSIGYEEAVREMRSFYDKGARILFFEGGEPTIWRDGDRDLSDLIRAGREIGYFVIGYTTNGTDPLFEEADVISVSLDGPKDVHDRIRAPGTFDSMLDNLEEIDHPNVFANMVVTKTNLDNVRETVELVSFEKHIRGIMINFLTPPPHDIALDTEEKERVVDLALKMRGEGLPVLNTEKALREMLIEDYEERCPFWVSAFVMPDGTQVYGCPMVHTESCKECGFNAVREYRLITKGSFRTINQMSRRFALSTKER